MRKCKSAPVAPLLFYEALEPRTLLSAGPQIVGYLPDYEFSHFSSIDLSALTQINYFSIVASSTGSLGTTSSSGYSLSQLSTVVSAAHAAVDPVSVNIVIDPSSAFQTIAQSTSATNAFITNILNFCSTYHLDGIDLDYEPGTLTTAQQNTWGAFLATLHAQTSAHGLRLSEAVQVSQMIIPQADISDLDQYNVMVYDLNYNSSAPYSESISYLTGWANYGVPKQDLVFGMPFYGRSGTSWSNTTTESYSQIMTAYANANGGAFPSPSLDSVTINGITWGFNGIDTVENKTAYALENGYGGVMIWELGQDYFSSGKYTSQSLLPAIKSIIGAAWETWTGAVSNDWTNAANWNYGQVPTSATNVVINAGAPSINSPFSVASLVLNGGSLTLGAAGAVYSTRSLTVNPTATLNVAANELIVDYGSGTDPIASVAALIASGYAGGSWTGTGITSSAAAANSASYGLGFADSADPGNPANLSSGQVEILFTLLGDANLDGKVNGTDFAILSSNFNQAVTSWDQGDFNYDGKVNGTDFALLSSNFNQGISPAVVDSTVLSQPSSLTAASAGSDSPTDPTTALASITPAKHPKRHESLITRLGR